MEKCVHLKDRLNALASYVENSKITADIGCDHGRLCVSLLQSGRAEYAVASDISSDSLRKAEVLRDKCGLTDRMRVCLADGLSGLTEKPDTIIIAGMGGRLIADIIARGEAITHDNCKLILQPMRGVAQLREFLHKNGYSVIGERLCKESGRIYQIICAVYSGKSDRFEILPSGFYEIGELMLKQKDPLLSEYMKRLERELKNAVGLAEENGVELDVLRKKMNDVMYIQEKLR